jgi:sugar lactone lactonase YvrE
MQLAGHSFPCRGRRKKSLIDSEPTRDSLRRPLQCFVVVILGTLLLTCGCSRTKPASPVATPIVWPAPPESARIVYVQTVLRPADLGLKFSPFTRFGHWLTGSDKGNEPLLKPFGLALDEKDNLCVTDTGANAVCYYDQAKKKWYRWQKIGGFQFVSPVAVAKRSGTFYVADSGLGRVIVFGEDEKLQTQLTNHLSRPSGLAILNDELYVADSQRHAIVVFDLRGIFRREFGRRGTGPGEFNFPTHIVSTRAGLLYVTDSMNSRVQILDSEGEFKGQLGQLGDRPGQFGRPKGLAVDSHGYVYAMDALFDNLQIFDPKGQLLLSLGETGALPGEFWLPNGIAINRQDEIYIADSYNRRIQVFKHIGLE